MQAQRKHVYFHWGIIYNTQDTETTETFIEWWADK